MTEIEKEAEMEIEEGFVDITENKNGGCLKKILVEGSGDESPPVGSHVSVHYVGTLHADGSKFDSSRDRPGTFKFDVGVGQVIKGWDTGICSMKKGEKCILRCNSDYAYGDHGHPPTIPGGATLNFEVELFSWKEKVKEPYEMSPEEKQEFATKQKEIGNAAFKKEDWSSAIEGYEEGMRYIMANDDDDDDEDGGHDHGHSHGGKPCSGAHGGDDDEDAPAPKALSDSEKVLAIALLSNCAAAKLKINEPSSAVEDCTKAIKIDPTHVKTVFRRAQGHLALGSYAACVEDGKRVLELDSTNKAAEQLIKKAELEERNAKKKEKAMYSKMFG